jgi:class 3 adenylate cyclase
MEQGFIDILNKLITEKGREILFDSSRCKALLADYTQNEYKKESRLLLYVFEAGVQKAIDTSPKLVDCKKQQIRLLYEECSLVEKVAVDVVDTLALVLRGDTSKTKITTKETASKTERRSTRTSMSGANPKIRTAFEPDNDPYSIIFSSLDSRYIHYIKNHTEINIKDFVNKAQNSTVLSIDIRKSTELMLGAKSENNFVKFVMELIEKMMVCIKMNHGVFEKFTGDGILAFFPDFYTGKDSCSHAINTAVECHSIFKETYRKYRGIFKAPFKTGLGIGIDYGKITLKLINNSVNIIGIPVVYACRLGGIKAGKTAISYQVFKKIERKLPRSALVEEELSLKTGGPLECYSVCEKINGLPLPVWEGR